MTLCVVVPVYNEQEVLPLFVQRLTATLDGIAGGPHRMLFVNDGSSDATPLMLQRLGAVDSRIVVVHLSRNFGHQSAISAGLTIARGRAVIIMDGDLQDPPEVLVRFIEKWREGYDVVFAELPELAHH